MGFGKAQFLALFLCIPLLALLLLPYYYLYGFENLNIVFNLWFILSLVLAIVAHELLHGIGWAYYADGGMKSIKFGFNWKAITPYCHCKAPLQVKHYKIGAALPLIVLGLLPVAIALIIESGTFLAFGIILSCAAGGDILALIMLAKLNNEKWVYDHPEKMGFISKEC